jgi:hypothetical protein
VTEDMALNQPINRYAWALEVKKATGSSYHATRDLPDDNHVTDLGAFYKRSIESLNASIVEELVDGFYGVHSPSNVTFTLDNSEFAGETAVTAIPGLELWLKADQISGVAAGGTITSWPDDSGNGHAATQVSGTLCPTLAVDVVNGHNVARFDNANDGMVTTAVINALPLSAFVVYAHRGGTADGFRRAVQSASGGGNWLIGPYQQGGGSSRYSTYNGAFLPDGPVTTQNAFVIQSVVQQTGLAEHWINATSYGTNAQNGVVGTIALGAGGTFAEPGNCDIAEVIFYRRALTPLERGRVEGYLALKYGLSGPTLAPGLDPAYDYRGTPAVLKHYDLQTREVTTELSGIIIDAQFPDVGKAVVTIGSHFDGLLDTPIPTRSITPDVTAFANAIDVGAATPVVFGSSVPVRPPYFATKDTTTNPPGYDALVSIEDALVEKVYTDNDQSSPGLERLHRFTEVPGSPTYLSGTQFTVTHSAYIASFYNKGTPLRFMASGTAADFTYTNVVEYVHTGTATSGTVRVADNVLTNTWGTVETTGDYLVIRDGYDGIDLGTGPADLTAIRTYVLDARTITAVASRASVSNPASAVANMINSTVWGLSSVGAAQTVSGTSILQAAIDFQNAGLGTAVAGALAYDRQTRRARDAINELLMMRGARLGFTTDNPPEWTVTVDTLPAAATLTFGLGPGTYNNIVRLLGYSREPLSRAVRNLVLAYKPLGRARDKGAKFTTAEYSRRATCAVSSRGQDRVIQSQWIRDEDIAARVVYYLAKRLKHADRKLSILVGQEGRQVRVGQLVHIEIPHLGIDADWFVARTTRNLLTTQLDLIGHDAEIYSHDAAQVSDSGEPNDTEPERPNPAPTNLLRNPSFGGPLRQEHVVFPPILDAMITLPDSWELFNGYQSGTAWIDTRREDESAALAAQMESGHYWEVELLRAPVALHGIRPTERFAVAGSTTYVPSIRASTNAGVYMQVEWYTASGTVPISVDSVPLVYDATNVNGAGWGRFYGRLTSPSNAALARPYYLLAQTGTYQLEAPLFHEAGPSARPVQWKNEHPSPTWLRRSQLVTMTAGQADIDVTDLILPGEEVKGVLFRINGTVSFQSGGSSYSVGLPQSGGGIVAPGAWGSGLTYTSVGALSTESDWTQPQALIYPTGATVRFSVDQGGGKFGGGTVRVHVLYRRELPAGLE